SGGHRISDVATDCLEMDVLTRGDELKVPRKTLKQGRLSEGDRSVLFRMPESPASVVEALSRNRRSRGVPQHPAIHTWVPASELTLRVASCHQARRPVSPGATGLR